MIKLRTAVLPFLVALAMLATACGAGANAPSSPGQYPVQAGSVHFDGDNYQLYWADSGGTLHRMDTHNLRLVQDPNGTFLEVPQSGDPVLHLRQDEPITVQGQDRQGAFSSPWFPFLLGATLGNTFGGGRGGQTIVINNPAPGESRSYDPATPAYRYPPTGAFGRDDELHGTVDSSKAQTPDYSRVQPSPYATAGKSSGTGGGTAVSSKGGFASGTQSYSKTGSSGSTGAGSKGVLPGGSSGSSSKPSTGIGGSSSSSSSKGIGGARSVGRR